MFNWFWNLFKPDDYYRPSESLIYKYFDGKRKVSADPLVLYRRLMEKGTDLSLDIQVAISMHNDRFKARIAMIDKIRWIFSVKVLEEGGLTEAECEALLDHFVNWCDDLKKKVKPTPTSQVVVSQPTKTLSDVDQRMKNIWDSGSIVPEPKIENLPS